MSKSFFGHAFHRDPTAPTTTAAPRLTTPKSSQNKEVDQVSVLYELGLLSASDKRPRRRATTGAREEPGEARVAGSYPNPQGAQKSTQPAYFQFHPLLRSSEPLAIRM
jgi:hypothetical protein